MQVIELTEQRFGRLTVLRRAPATGGEARWVARCDCGNETHPIKSTLLRDGRSRSCGCLKREAIAKRSTTHGHSPRSGWSPTYGTWVGLKGRCTNPRYREWFLYGGRGIRVCDRWLDFAAFLEDMGPRPDGQTIDRIDNDGNYEPNNCRWATDSRQARNRRSNRLMTNGGVTKTLVEWAEALGIPHGRIRARLKRGDSDERALRLEVAPSRWLRSLPARAQPI